MDNVNPDRSYGELDDHALMELCKIGDEQAFREIYDRHAENIMGFLIKFCGDRHIAADVVQETFEYLFRNVEEYEPNAPLHSLLYKVARNTCLKKLRGKRKETNMDLQWDDLESDATGLNPVDRLNKSERADIVRSTVRTLPEHVREVVVLRVMEGLKYSEISDVVDIPLGTVKSRLHNGLDLLRNRLREKLDPDRDMETK